MVCAVERGTLPSVENRLADPLRRLYQADKLWTDDGHEPMPFLLSYYVGVEQPSVTHPGWDNSWARPSYQTIDDLAEMAFLRVERSHGWDRTFSLTMNGRDTARALLEQLATPITLGERGPIPMIDETLEWLIRTRKAAPDLFREPVLLIDQAIADGLIEAGGRDTLASHLLHLIEAGRLTARFVPDIDQATPEQTLRGIQGMEIAIGATTPATGQHFTFNAPVSQFAAGDITNYSIFIEVLNAAWELVDEIGDYDDDTRSGARSLLDRLRGRAASASGAVASAASTDLAVEAIKRVFGL
jgi:hypothetical protein